VSQVGSAPVRLAFVQISDAGRGFQPFISAFETGIVTAHNVSLRIANQPIAGIYVDYASRCRYVGGLIHLNRFHQKRLH
jgi:hypothetical protein